MAKSIKKVRSGSGCSSIDITLPQDVLERLNKELENPQHKKPWELWEVKILKENKELLSHKQLATVLNRTRSSIKSKLDAISCEVT